MQRINRCRSKDTRLQGYKVIINNWNVKRNKENHEQKIIKITFHSSHVVAIEFRSLLVKQTFGFIIEFSKISTHRKILIAVYTTWCRKQVFTTSKQLFKHKSTTQLLIPKSILQDEVRYQWINLKDGVSPQRGAAKE